MTTGPFQSRLKRRLRPRLAAPLELVEAVGGFLIGPLVAITAVPREWTERAGTIFVVLAGDLG